MKLQPSNSQGTIGIAGHAGIGHAFTSSGFLQEDSGGFAILLTLLDKASHLDIQIASVSVVDGECVVVTTQGGGRGSGRALHGFTPYEERMMQQAVGLRCAAPQTLASRIYGRIYGQGADPQGSAFCLACAKAMLDTVRVQWPGKVFFAPEDLPDCCGAYLGGMLDIGDIPVSWLLTINASSNGTGPNEDSEGCIPIGNKGDIMRTLGMDAMPLLVLEGKAYVPGLKPPLQTNSLFVRWNNEHDNPVVGQCYARAARESGYPVLVQDDTYPRQNTALPDEAYRLGQRIVQLGEAYGQAGTASEKISLMAELATICSHDSGGTIFMSNGIHYYAGNGGLWPGLGAMLSFIVTRQEAMEWKTLRFTDEELDLAVTVLVKAAGYLHERRDEAQVFVEQRRPPLTNEDIMRLACL